MRFNLTAGDVKDFAGSAFRKYQRTMENSWSQIIVFSGMSNNRIYLYTSLSVIVTSQVRDRRVRVIGRCRVAGVDAGRTRKQVQVGVRRIQEHRVQEDVVVAVAGIAVMVQPVEHAKAGRHASTGAVKDIIIRYVALTCRN